MERNRWGLAQAPASATVTEVQGSRMSRLFALLVVRIKFQDERGATAVEYAIMAALIAAVIVTTVSTVGTKTNGLFEQVRDAITW